EVAAELMRRTGLKCPSSPPPYVGSYVSGVRVLTSAATRFENSHTQAQLAGRRGPGLAGIAFAQSAFAGQCDLLVDRFPTGPVAGGRSRPGRRGTFRKAPLGRSAALGRTVAQHPMDPGAGV